MYSGSQASYENLSENMKQKLEELKIPIVNDLTTGGSDKALSAESGKELKSLVDEKADGEDLESLQTEVNEHLADNTSHIEWLETVGGTANALTATHKAIASYKNGLGVSFPAKTNSTAAATLNINSLGVIPIKKANGSVVTNLKANGVYTVRYRDGAFILQGEGGSGNALANDIRKGKTATSDIGDITGTLDLSLLTPSNLKKDVVVDGVTGSLIPGAQYTKVTVTTSARQGSPKNFYWSFVVTGLSFEPKTILSYGYSYPLANDYGNGISSGMYAAGQTGYIDFIAQVKAWNNNYYGIIRKFGDVVFGVNSVSGYVYYQNETYNVDPSDSPLNLTLHIIG